MQQKSKIAANNNGTRRRPTLLIEEKPSRNTQNTEVTDDVIDAVHVKEVIDGGDEEPALPEERLECEATMEEMPT